MASREQAQVLLEQLAGPEATLRDLRAETLLRTPAIQPYGQRGHDNVW